MLFPDLHTESIDGWNGQINAFDDRITNGHAIRVIQSVVCEDMKVNRAELLSKRRQKSLTLPRHIGMWLCRQLTSYTLTTIGDHWGRRDHTTVMHACKKVDELLDESPEVNAITSALIRRLT